MSVDPSLRPLHSSWLFRLVLPLASAMAALGALLGVVALSEPVASAVWGLPAPWGLALAGGAAALGALTAVLSLRVARRRAPAVDPWDDDGLVAEEPIDSVLHTAPAPALAPAATRHSAGAASAAPDPGGEGWGASALAPPPERARASVEAAPPLEPASAPAEEPSCAAEPPPPASPAPSAAASVPASAASLRLPTAPAALPEGVVDSLAAPPPPPASAPAPPAPQRRVSDWSAAAPADAGWDDPEGPLY